VLGALHGPAELLPVSSSGHLVLVPALLGWRYEHLDAELRKAFEVAVHGGTAAALAITLRREVAEVLTSAGPRRLLGIALAFAPPAAFGLRYERAVEERLGSPRRVAGAQVLAGLLLVIADRRPARRSAERAGVGDHLLIGFAQATALAPGVSRNGATLTVARLRQFRRRDANRLSRHAALPVIAGALTLKGVRLARRRPARELAVPFATGALAAFGSTLACSGLVEWMDGASTYRAVAAYRVLLGSAALVVLHRRPREVQSGL